LNGEGNYSFAIFIYNQFKISKVKQTKMFFFAVLLLLPVLAYSQDVIMTTEGSSIQGRVFKITPKQVKYKNIGTPDSGVTHTIQKKEVHEIDYETGVKETFNEQEKYIDDNDPEGHWDKRSMARMGREDAQDYYEDWTKPKWWTYGLTVGTGGILGLIPAIAISASPVRNRNLGYPDEELMKNHKYSKAYKREAKRIKSRKVWGGWGLGCLTLVALGGVVIIL
jgi:hypothetical protein